MTSPRVPPLLRAALASVVLAVVVVITLATQAAAHTDLESTNPADGTTLQRPVEEVTLTFTLPVTRLGDGVTLTGPSGTIPAEVSSQQDGVVWTAVPEEPLTNGTYTGEWTVAAEDGHPLSGEFTFTVEGDPAGQAPAEEETADAAEDTAAPAGSENGGQGGETGTEATTQADASGFAEVMARLGSAAALWGALVAGGALIFAKFVLRGADRDDTPVVAMAMRWAAALILLALALRVMSRAVLVSQGDIAAAFSPSAIGESLGGTTRWVLGLQAVGALAVLVGARGMLTKPWLAGAGLLVIGAGHVLAGHSNTIEPRWLVLLADVAHLLAAAVWVGGVVILGMLLRHRRRQGRSLNAALVGARFSVLAAGSVAVVGAAGAILAFLILDRPEQLWQTSWGLFLLAKVAVVAVVAGLGAYNHFRVVPALTSTARQEALGGDASELLRRSATHETAIMFVIVLLTAWLVASSVAP